MNKRLLFFLALSLLLVISFMKLISMRRPLPFQEIVAIDKGIALVNAQKWFIDDLTISYSSADGQKKAASFDKNGVCVISSLNNAQEYAVEIGRTDLKGRLLYKKFRQKATPHEGGDDYFVLVGASIGKAWDIGNLPERLGGKKREIVLGTRTVYLFDKSEVIADLVRYPFPVAGVIIKECSAYFPRDLEHSKKEIISWVQKLVTHNIKPILATTVPVTSERARKEPDKLRSLLQYNDFIRQYAQENNLLTLDLEKALRVNEQNRHLRDDYAQEDGAHLVEKAYHATLDNIFFPSLGL